MFPQSARNLLLHVPHDRSLEALGSSDYWLRVGQPCAAAGFSISISPFLTNGESDVPTCGPNTQGGNFDCSTGAVVAFQEAPFYSPQARIHACVVPFSGHSVSLAINRRLQAADSVAWSSAFVGQRKFHERRDLDEGPGLFDGLLWNDNLPCNCGGSQ